MADLFKIKRNDRRPRYRVQLTANDEPVDLTGASGVKFLMGSAATTVEGVATIVDAATGVVEYAWAVGDTATAGEFNVEFEVDWGADETQTFPDDGYFAVKITTDLG